MAYGKCLNCGKLGHSMAECHDTPPAASAHGFREWWESAYPDVARQAKNADAPWDFGAAVAKAQEVAAKAAWEVSEAASRAKLESAEAELARLRSLIEIAITRIQRYDDVEAVRILRTALAEPAKKEGKP
jgi:hypothetical protein